MIDKIEFNDLPKWLRDIWAEWPGLAREVEKEYQASELLLKKYIRYVFECEGGDNIRYGRDYASDTEFTEEEWKKLEKIAIEVNGENI